MKRIIFSLLLIVLSLGLKAQKPLPNYTWYDWYGKNRFFGPLRLPLDTLPTADTGSIAYKNGTLYIKDTTGVFVRMAKFSEAGSGSSADSTLFATLYRMDTMRTNLYQQLGLKLNITDTSGKWIGIGWLTNLMKYADTASKTWDWSDITGKPTLLVPADTVNKYVTTFYRKPGTDSVFFTKGGAHTFAFIDSVGSGGGGGFTVDSIRYNSTTSTITLYQTGASDLSTYINSSYLLFDSTFSPFGGSVNDSTAKVKSGRIQLNGSTVTPTVTDSTISWNISVSGGTGDTAYYDPNPSHWYHTKSTNNPTFARVTASENTTYVPSGFQGPDGRWWAFVKGDLYNRIYKYYSNDNGKNWTYDGIAVKPRNTHQDSTYNLEPYAHLVGDSVYLYYMGGGSYPLPNFGIWLATCHYDSLYGNAEPFAKGSTPMLSNAQFQSLIGVGYQVGYIGLSSIVKKDGQYYFHGGWLNGNVSVNPVLRTRLWVGVGTDYRNITSIDSIPIPLDSIQVGVKAPSVWKENDYYKMIFSKGDPYYNGGYLMSAYSSDLINWTQYADSFAFPTADTSWEGKQIYSGQLMKIQSDNYDQPLLVNEDTVYGGPQPYSYGYYTYLFSASYDSIYFVDQAGVMRIYPQKSTPLFATDDNGKHPHSVQRNTTTVLNIPKSGMAKNGYLDSLDYRRFYYKADSSGQWSYIQNRTTQQTDANFNIGGYGYTRKFNAGGALPDGSAFALTADGYQISGNAFQIRNASNYGILRNFVMNSEVNDYWYGSGQGFAYQYTGSNAINWQAYKYNFRSIFSPLAPMLTMYGRSDHDTTIEMNTTRGVSFPHTDAGITQFVGHTDYYNTTSSALNSYAVEAKNTATRSSGSNNLTNYGGRFSASGGQANYSLSLGNPAQYEANYGSSYTSRSLVDKNYVDSIVSALTGGGMANPMTTAGDIITGGSGGSPQRLAAGTEGYVLKIVSGVPAWASEAGGGGSWSTSGNSLTANVDFIGSTNNTSMRFKTNNSQRLILDSLGNMTLSTSRANPVYSNAKLNITATGSTSSAYSLYVDDAFNSLQHYLRNDGAAYHSGALSVGTTITTGNPSSGAGAWRLGVRVASSGLTLDSTQYIEISIGGTVYKLALVNTP